MIFGEGNVINANACFGKPESACRRLSNFLWFLKFERTMLTDPSPEVLKRDSMDYARGERLLKIVEKRGKKKTLKLPPRSWRVAYSDDDGPEAA